MFVQFVLQTLWQVYDAVLLSPDAVKRDKIISSLGLHVPPRELKNADPSVQLRAIMGQWLPLGRNVLRAVVEVMPSADTAQRMRLELLCPEMLAVPAVAPESAPEGAPAGASLSGTAAAHGSSSGSCDDSVADQSQQPGACGAAIAASSDGVEDGGRQDDFERALGRLRAGVEGCSTTAPVVVYIAKMVWVSGVAGAHPDDAFIGFARVFSGTVRPGSGGFLHVLHAQPCADRAHPAAVVQIPVDALRLYVMMGRELQSVSSVTAGTVCGVGGIGSAVLKCGTLSSDPRCPPFARMSMEGAPIVQVAVEPTEVGMLQELERGLALLDQADPSVEVHCPASTQSPSTAASGAAPRRLPPRL
jgi:ribosome assembly protein 1